MSPDEEKAGELRRLRDDGALAADAIALAAHVGFEPARLVLGAEPLPRAPELADVLKHLDRFGHPVAVRGALACVAAALRLAEREPTDALRAVEAWLASPSAALAGQVRETVVFTEEAQGHRHACPFAAVRHRTEKSAGHEHRIIVAERETSWDAGHRHALSEDALWGSLANHLHRAVHGEATTASFQAAGLATRLPGLLHELHAAPFEQLVRAALLGHALGPAAPAIDVPVRRIRRTPPAVRTGKAVAARRAELEVLRDGEPGAPLREIVELAERWCAQPVQPRDGVSVDAALLAEERCKRALPRALVAWHFLVGERLSGDVQDPFVPLSTLDSGDGLLAVMTENQGGWALGVRPDDCHLDDPPVYLDGGDAFELCAGDELVCVAPSLSALLPGLLRVAIAAAAGFGHAGPLGPLAASVKGTYADGAAVSGGPRLLPDGFPDALFDLRGDGRELRLGYSGGLFVAANEAAKTRGTDG